MAQHEQHSSHAQHVTPVRTYLLGGAALAVLTVITVAVAFVDLSPFNDLVAVAIAALKASVIVFVFMHARATTGITRLVMVAGLLWLGIMLVGIFDDYLTRDWLSSLGSHNP